MTRKSLNRLALGYCANFGVVIVHVAQRDHVLAFARHGVNVGTPLAADADAGHVELFVGGQALRPLQRTAGENVKRGHARAGSADKLPPVDQVGFVLVHGVMGSSFLLVNSVTAALRIRVQSQAQVQCQSFKVSAARASVQKPEWTRPRKGAKAARTETRNEATSPAPMRWPGWLSANFLISNLGAPNLINRPCSILDARK